MRVEGVEGNIQATNTGRLQLRQFALQQLAIGSQRDIVEIKFGHASQKGVQARADQRFTAGDAQALDAGSFDQVGHATGQGVC